MPGTTDALANQFVTGFRSQSLAGRHPLLAMIGAPVLGTFALLVPAFAICMGILAVSLHGESGLASENDPWIPGYIMAGCAISLVTFAHYPLATLLVARAWQETGRNWQWFAGAMAVQLVLSLMVVLGFRFDAEAPAAIVEVTSDVIAGETHASLILAQAVPQLLVAVLVMKRLWNRSVQNNQKLGTV